MSASFLGGNGEKLVGGVMGVLPESPTDEVTLPIDQGIADSPRTACKILSPLPKLCKGHCVRLQIPSRDVEVLHICSVRYAVATFEAIELSSLTWVKLCRGFSQLHSALPCCLRRGQAARISLLQQAGPGSASMCCLFKSYKCPKLQMLFFCGSSVSSYRKKHK